MKNPPSLTCATRAVVVEEGVLLEGLGRAHDGDLPLEDVGLVDESS